jgi:threonine/homoserine/homoserine lactone efflux protein
MDIPALGVFIVASLALILTPGQDMLFVVARSVAQGRFAGVCSAVGVILGILVHTALAAFGVGALLQASETLFVALKLVGAAYLVYLGARLILSREMPQLDDARRPRVSSARSLVWQGMLSNITNPKIILFFFAFLPQFVDPASAHPTRNLVFLGVLYAAMGLPAKVGVALAAGGFSERLLGRPGAITWMNRASGTVLVLLGLRLAAAERP